MSYSIFRLQLLPGLYMDTGHTAICRVEDRMGVSIRSGQGNTSAH